MSAIRVGVIGAGEMGSAIGALLVARGADVRTTLAGRSAASAERVRRAGMTVSADLAALARDCTIVLSIIPPDKVVEVAEAFAAAYVPRSEPPVYVDCNAVAPETARAVGEIVTSAGLPYIDAGIIGGPPQEGYDGPHIYAAGGDLAPFEALRAFGLFVRPLAGPPGVASALKMCYAGLTKGLTGIGSAMFACAESNGILDALREQMAESQAAMLTWLDRQLPTMPPKAYRWDPEMREIAAFGAREAGVETIYTGLAERYAAIAAQRTNGTRP